MGDVNAVGLVIMAVGLYASGICIGVLATMLINHRKDRRQRGGYLP